MASLVYSTAQKQKIRKNQIQKPISSEKTVLAKVCEGSPGEEVKLRGGGEVGFEYTL